jgi:hypothetical protein
MKNLIFLGLFINPNNRKFLIIFDAPFLLISFAAIIEETHWFLFLIFFMHAVNSMTLLIKPQLFYHSKDEMQLMERNINE